MDATWCCPEIGNIVATMEIRNVFEVTLRNGLKSKRAGCQFINLSANMQSMIQRYIIKVERERRAMELDRPIIHRVMDDENLSTITPFGFP